VGPRIKPRFIVRVVTRMDVLITGSEGYLGCVLWKAFKSRGHRVQGLDRGLYGVKNFDDDRAFARPEVVVNLAGLVGEQVCARNPELVNRTNVDFAVKQLKKAVVDCAKVFVQVSTTRVYGSREQGDCVDSVDEVGSSLPVYAASKLKAEQEVLSVDAKKTRVYVVRLADMCGPSPRMRFDQTANGIALMAGRNRKVILQNPANVRAYVSVRACANMICWLVEEGKKAATVLNYAGKVRTVEDIAGVCARALPMRVHVERACEGAPVDGLSYGVKCSSDLEHIEDGVDASLAFVTKEIYHYRWAGARADAKDWGNVGWRW
jgi:nucleoside-diphosphate-sugar epimerase